MPSEQSKGEAVLSSQAMADNDFKRIIAGQQREILVKNERLKGVENLVRICSEKETKILGLKTTVENLETALRRADARIAYLNKKLGIGPQTTLGIDVVSPGVSRKDFDAITRENIRLKEALEHIAPTELGGKDIVIKNRELYDLVNKLKEDVSQREHHVKELESMLNSSGDDLAMKFNDLTKENIKLKRSAQAKQVFSEKLLKENKKLNEIINHRHELPVVKQEKPDVIGRDVPDGQSDEEKLNVNAAKFNEERENLLKMVEEKEKLIQEMQEKLQELEREKENLSKRVTELTTESVKYNENKAKIEAELSDTTKKSAEYQKKCAGFFNQVMSLNAKQLEAEEEIASLKRSTESQRAQVSEKEAMIIMIRDQLKTYEDDFRRESEEKNTIKKKFESKEQENERLRRENQSHTATIRHFESEIERMSKLLNDEKHRPRNTNTTFQPFGSSSQRNFFQGFQNPTPIVVADGVGTDEASTTRGNASISSPKPSPTLIECPYCSRSYPYHLIEGHVQDCMEDSLYMDD